MKQELTRRRLDFLDFEAVVSDAEALAARGYDKVGDWDLGQVCGQLADFRWFSLDGLSRFALPSRLMLWLLRNTIAQRLLLLMLSSRSIPAGMRTVPQTVPRPGGDEAAAVERLRQAIARFRA